MPDFTGSASLGFNPEDAPTPHDHEMEPEPETVVWELAMDAASDAPTLGPASDYMAAFIVETPERIAEFRTWLAGQATDTAYDPEGGF
jgi:hypothetical protein